MRHIRVQLEERQTLFRSSKRSKSQSDIFSLNINQVKKKMKFFDLKLKYFFLD